ncbi:hypothetical protein [Fructilactobacillus cliffordii]|uniref:Uncharacterized protein n=1 Tax=Fructilactobacillus cliffordii TaxID=2940299 RepID=A0A9Q8ZW38_9LACO|nr:hypothetical protein [Fructilactobacillus cliffordii]USS88651.1 hypothetical protein M3M40_03885 [Fructilactobacillus cliffordii]
MKNNGKLLKQDLEKRFEQLEKNQPAPERTNLKQIILKIIIGLVGICFVVMILATMINF